MQPTARQRSLPMARAAAVGSCRIASRSAPRENAVASRSSRNVGSQTASVTTGCTANKTAASNAACCVAVPTPLTSPLTTPHTITTFAACRSTLVR